MKIMHQYIRLSVILLALFFVGCSRDKTESIFGEKPEERIARVLAEHKTTLTGAQFGWKTVIYPPDGGGYGFFFIFGSNDRVTMYGDVTMEAAGTANQSTYRLKAVQRPSLLFDTYSYLHLLSDPDPNVFGGNAGEGYKVDFEFSIDSVQTDSIKLTGITYGTKIVMTRATQAEYNAYTTGGYEDLITDIENYITEFPWQYLQFSDGRKVQVSLDPIRKKFSLSYLDDAGNVQLLSTAYSYTLNGVLLQALLTYNGNTFRELLWDANDEVFYIMINNQRVNVQVSPTAIVPMHKLLGTDFTSLQVASPAQPMPGWSTTYTNVWTAFNTSIQNGPYNLTIYFADYSFDVASSTMTLYIVVLQNNLQYVATFPFSYTKTAAGVFDFTGLAYSGNAALIATDAKPLLDYLRNDRFTMDFFIDSQQGYGKLGQLLSIEHPDFYFTGFMVKE